MLLQVTLAEKRIAPVAQGVVYIVCARLFAIQIVNYAHDLMLLLKTLIAAYCFQLYIVTVVVILDPVSA